MQLSEYISNLQKFQEEHGGDLNCFYASDAEGNSFQSLMFEPSLMLTNDPDGHRAELHASDEEFDEDDNMKQVCCVN